MRIVVTLVLVAVMGGCTAASPQLEPTRLARQAAAVMGALNTLVPMIASMERAGTMTTGQAAQAMIGINTAAKAGQRLADVLQDLHAAQSVMVRLRAERELEAQVTLIREGLAQLRVLVAPAVKAQIATTLDHIDALLAAIMVDTGLTPLEVQ